MRHMCVEYKCVAIAWSWCHSAQVRQIRQTCVWKSYVRMKIFHTCINKLDIFALSIWSKSYGVATISRLLKIIRLFCRISSLLQGSCEKETYNFEEPTHRSHPISCTGAIRLCMYTCVISALYINVSHSCTGTTNINRESDTQSSHVH